tara:strand:+ start:8875 stop:9315 length:441 start_codon:yes stop_codon:yes gene_type:complete
MANQLFGTYKAALLGDTAGFSWASGTMKTAAVTGAALAQVDIDTFATVNDIITAGSYGVSAERSADITGRSIGTTGEANSNSISFIGLTGSDVYAFAIYLEVDAADDTQNTLIAYLDTGNGLTGGFSPGGGTTTVSSSAPGYFFKL